MKADPFIQARLLTLADADADMTRLAHRRANLPEAAAAKDLAARSQAAKDAAAAALINLDDLARDVRKLEADVELVRTRIARDDSLLQAGSLPAKQVTGCTGSILSLSQQPCWSITTNFRMLFYCIQTKWHPPFLLKASH